MYPVDSPFRLRSRENKLSLKHRDFLGHVVVYLWLFIYTPVGQLGCKSMITSLLSITILLMHRILTFVFAKHHRQN